MPTHKGAIPRAYMTVAVFIKTMVIFIVTLIITALLGVQLYNSTIASIFVLTIFFAALLIAILHETKQHAKLDALLFRIEKLPIVSSAKAHFNYPIQLYGEIVANEPLLTSPYSANGCVYYHYIKEKLVRTKDSSYWKVVKDEIRYIDFSVEDSDGAIKIDPRNIDSILGSYYKMKKTTKSVKDFPFSEIECTQGAKHSKRLTKKKFLGFIPITQGNDIRHTEYYLSAETPVFVSGYVHNEKGKEVIAESEKYPLIVTWKSKSEYLDTFGDASKVFDYSNILLLTGLMIGFIGFLLFKVITLNPFTLIIFPILLIIIAIRWIIGTHNRLVMLEERCDNAEKNIDIQLRLRNDLIPKLVTVVKASTKFEKKVLNEITKTRVEIETKLTKDKLKEFYKAELKLQAILFRKEAYPTLSSSKNFNKLMDDLTEIENNISDSRKFYNKTATKYNIALNKFPNSMFKNFKHLNEKDLWKL
jgi:LemA protein